MTIENWPAGVKPRTAFVHLQKKSGRFQSPYVAGGQVANRAGARVWVTELNFADLTRPQSMALDALFARIQGNGVVEVPDFERVQPREKLRALAASGAYDSEPAGEYGFSDTGFLFSDTGFGFAGQAALTLSGGVTKGDTSLTVAGFLPGVEAVLPGQTFSIDGRLYQHKAALPAFADESGDVVLSFAPGARADHADGAQVRFSEPVCRMRLADDDQAGQASKIFKNLTLRFVEAID